MATSCHRVIKATIIDTVWDKATAQPVMRGVKGAKGKGRHDRNFCHWPNPTLGEKHCLHQKVNIYESVHMLHQETKKSDRA
jgi:hypothetical protein